MVMSVNSHIPCLHSIHSLWSRATSSQTTTGCFNRELGYALLSSLHCPLLPTHPGINKRQKSWQGHFTVNNDGEVICSFFLMIGSWFVWPTVVNAWWSHRTIFFRHVEVCCSNSVSVSCCHNMCHQHFNRPELGMLWGTTVLNIS